MIPKELLTSLCAKEGIFLEEEQVEKMNRFAKMLIRENERMNLTAITDPKEMVIKHFLDSLFILRQYDIPKRARVLDLGAGAGFPSVPLAILRDDLSFVQLDSLQKRIRFLESVRDELALDTTPLHGRAETLGKDPSMREQFDIVIARAVAPMNRLCEYALPFVRLGGMFLAMKAHAREECEQASAAISRLGGSICGAREYCLPDHSRRALILTKKISQTPTTFPRSPAKIARSPL